MVRLLFGILGALMSANAGAANEANTAPVSKVLALHSAVISPASDALFRAESTPPSTADAWAQLQGRALDLAQAAKRLESKDLAKDQKQWVGFAEALQAEAQRAARAAEGRDQDALVTANGNIVSVCEDCHDRYRDAGHGMKR
jgi:hypothetical protein